MSSANLRQLEEIEALSTTLGFTLGFMRNRHSRASATKTIPNGGKYGPKWPRIRSPSGRKDCPVATARASATSAADFRDSPAILAHPILSLHAFYFSSHSRFPFYRSNIPIRGHEAHRPKNTKPVPSGSGSPLRAKYLSQVAAKTPSLSEVPSAGWVVAPPWGRGRGLSPGGSLHRCVERPPTKRRTGTRDTGAVQRRRQRPGPRPRSLPPHQ